MNTVLLAQDSAYTAGVVAGRLLLSILGFVLIGVGIRRSVLPRPGAGPRRGGGWMIGVGVVLVLAGASAAARAA